MIRNLLEELRSPRPPRNRANAPELARVLAMYDPDDDEAPSLIALSTVADLIRGTEHAVLSVSPRRRGLTLTTTLRSYHVDEMGHFS